MLNLMLNPFFEGWWRPFPWFSAGSVVVDFSEREALVIKDSCGNENIFFEHVSHACSE